MNVKRPKKEDIAPSFHRYFDLVQGDDIFNILNQVHDDTNDILKDTPIHLEDFRYAPDKWTLKEVMCHLISSETYFCDLALRITKDQNSTPISYSLEKYEMKKNAYKSLNEILNDFDEARSATIDFLNSFDQELIGKIQTINENQYSPTSIGYIIAGHEIHHLNIIKDKYLTES